MPAATLVALATPPCDAYTERFRGMGQLRIRIAKSVVRSGVSLGPASRSGGWDIVSAHLLRIVFVEHHGAARPVLDDVSALVPSRLSFAGSQQRGTCYFRLTPLFPTRFTTVCTYRMESN
jgi:hypothetical protein